MSRQNPLQQRLEVVVPLAQEDQGEHWDLEVEQAGTGQEVGVQVGWTCQLSSLISHGCTSEWI